MFGMSREEKLTAVLEMKSGGFTSGLKTSRNEMKKLRQEAKEAGRGLDSLGDKANKAGRNSSKAFSGLGNVAKGAIGIIGKVGAVVGTVTAALGLMSLKMAQTRETQIIMLTGALNDAAKAKDVFRWANKEANITPFENEELASATVSLTPFSKDAKNNFDMEKLKRNMKLAELLAISNPREGLEGAGFSVKEALGGDFTSIVERFNLSRNAINDMKDKRKPKTSDDYFKIIEEATMQQYPQGYSMIDAYAKSNTGLMSTISGTGKDVMSGFGEGFLDELNPDMALFAENMTKTADAKRELMKEWGAGAVKGWKEAMEAGQVVLDYFEPSLRKIKAEMEALRTLFEIAWPGISKGLDDVWKLISPILDAWRSKTEKQADATERLVLGLQQLKKEQGASTTNNGSGGGGTVFSTHSPIKGNANGTDNWRGGLTWVGEGGKELANLPGGTEIVPANKTWQAGRKGGNLIQLIIQGANLSEDQIVNSVARKLEIALAEV